ncbi:lipopolysaccharide biosynthesis protein [Limobrevibacterium gyesilva]|uniref:Lipopolysaccharide biosynthesis protein n=1 Tax=Limobrevibacterium gyesilva TaxID=2991712 RepID=A0AA41YQJ5_9PROT|nr:lipopolysaccharide biosynthesis protein [Limobrevibacterium gyesilva]MCW3476891.1 lipopolysaccharide biosynthesis protein [Limobrevibacterium gyesilva]
MTDEAAPASLLLKTATGTGWIIGWRLATRALGLVSTLVLVRLLMPADFGLVALATSFAQAIEAFSWLGIEEAVIREKDPPRKVYDTAFTLNMIRGLVSGAVILGLAWPAGSFFSEPRMVEVLMVLALVIALDGVENIGIVDFRREFAFRKEFQLWILPRLAGIVLTLALAAMFHSYWALIAGILAQRVLRVAFSYVMHPYRPRLSLQAWRGMLGYSLWTWAISSVGLLRNRADTILIGRMLNPAQVGIYSVGAEIAALPTTELVLPLCRAAFSGFSAGRHVEQTPGGTYLRIIGTMALLTLPAGVGISLVAEPLVALAFGAQWAQTAPLIEILALAGTVTVLGSMSATLFQVHGLMAGMFRIEAMALLLRVVLIAAGVQAAGLVGAAVAVAVAMAVEQGLYARVTFRQFDLRPGDLLRATWRSLLATAAMAIALHATGLGWHRAGAGGWPPATGLGLGVVLGAMVYVAVLLASWLAAGRPAGAELDALALLRRLLGQAAARLRAG